jgi:hypothetical protein
VKKGRAGECGVLGQGLGFQYLKGLSERLIEKELEERREHENSF